MPDPQNPEDDTGMLVESWDLENDLSKVTLKLHEGVQFHDGWGEMTAEDAAWSVNDANADLTEGAVHGQSGDIRLMFNEWKAVDRYTVEAPFNQFDATWRRGLLNVWFSTVDVLSKKVHDDLGPEEANETRVATGPFRVESWLQDDQIEAEAVPDHWRVQPKIERFTVRAIPEESARVAAIKTGEIDIAEVAVLRNVQDLRESGIEMNDDTDERESPAILFAGNLWQVEDPLDGDTLERPGFDPDLPWIGDPDGPGCDRENLFSSPSPENICESMDNARKVRLAMAMAIDGEAINDAVLDGLGAENKLPWFSHLNEQLWEDRWDVPFDPERARELLAEAGYPDGFEVTPNLYHSQIYGPAPISRAAASMWRDNLGLTVSVDLQDYSTFRPSIVERSRSGPWMSGCDYGRNLPADWPIGSLASALSRGGFSCGFEAPFYSDFHLELSQEADPAERVRLKKELGDYHRFWMHTAGTVEVPGLWAVNPDTVAEWGLRRGFKNTLNSLETIQVK
ncbi:MAG: ABC transporter substrate-binding protein [Chloroflexota bacterium]